MNKFMTTLVEFVATILSLGLSKITEWLHKKQTQLITEVAIYIENTYAGESGEKKKEMFLAILKETKKVSLKFASYYLEKYIIPTTKAINCYQINKQEISNDDKEYIA